MSSQTGKRITVSVFGESHGPAIGAVIDSPPAGINVDMDYISLQLKRRAPGNSPTATKRKEADMPEFLSGIKNGMTTGAPLAAIIRNTNTKSEDYSNLKIMPRPSHADYAAFVHYNGFNDISGGGHFSGRLTAPLVAGGSVLRLYLKNKGINIAGHILQIGKINDQCFDPISFDSSLADRLSASAFSLIDESVKSAMEKEILSAAEKGDSVGGVVEIMVSGLPAGLGGPMFDGAENIISSAVFGVPAVKGIEFGEGFKFAEMHGSEANDAMTYDEEKNIRCVTNHCGGITGGITNSMPIVFRAAVKPTPSISLPQQTVDLEKKANAEITIHGRHDPCIVPRALPAIEAVTAIAVANLLGEVCPL